VQGGAGVEGVVPAGLEGGLEVVAHAVGGVGVQAAHAGDFVAEALLGEDFGDAVFGHPGLVAVPQAMRSEAMADGEPAGQRGVVGDDADAVAVGWLEVSCGPEREDGPGGDGGAGPVGGVGDDQAGGVAGDGFVAAVAGGTEDAAGVVAAAVVAAVGGEEQVASAAAMLGSASAGPS
jgi:hypothetical protein